ncbi:MAG: hypothetical protein R3B72_02260 [Polyangiaceae bacterium]
MRTMRRALILGIGCLAMACGGGETSGSGGEGGTPTGVAVGAGGTGSGAGGSGSGGEGTGGQPLVDCHPAMGDPVAGSTTWQDGAESATVVVDDPASCARSYSLASTQPRVDDLPASPRTVVELADQPVARTNHALFDALYALALEEVRENSVDAISDGAFNSGTPLPCPPGGCFETGRKWTYVWTRDTSYAVHLGLGLLDPPRAKNSLAFKLSERRGGGDLQIVQDTGTGGSYPISSDRVVWALGAWELLKYLDGSERDAFRDLAYEAIANTADHDRVVVFDAGDGLYRGEQSFLDWREQSYPSFTAGDPTQIGASKALSTNVGHLRLLEIAAALASEKGLTSDAGKYQGWADALKGAIATRLWLDEDQGFSTFAPSSFDPAPVRRFDLLGTALAVLAEVGTPSQRAAAVESYPHLPQGPPVIWPQQQFTAIYHNRGIWPFVTAFWLEAAKATKNAAAVTAAARSLMRGAALNLSNMENFEAASGKPWVDDGAFSGPVVNSQRQLWSVAGYVSFVQKIVFGLEASQTGVRFAPFLPRALVQQLFPGQSRIALSRLPYKGGQIAVVLELDPADTATTGALEAVEVRLNGASVGSGMIEADMLTGNDLFTVTLGPATGVSDDLTALSAADLGDYKRLFGPRTPTVSDVSLDGGLLGLSLDVAGEAAGEVAIDVYRDGLRVAQDLPGTTSYWVDPTSGTQSQTSHCYAIETHFVASGTRSQHSAARCYWGPGFNRIQSYGAQGFSAQGGSLVFNHGEWHYENWGAPSDSLTVTNLSPSFTGEHLIQLRAGNGSGSITTGVTCGVKRVRVLDGSTEVARGYLAMPQLGSWSEWRESTTMRVDLEASKTYTLVIDEDATSVNMSERQHFETYGGTGGTGGRFNRVNISEVKVLARDF